MHYGCMVQESCFRSPFRHCCVFGSSVLLWLVCLSHLFINLGQNIIMPVPVSDVTSQSGLEKLNDYLSDRSYIEGYQPSQADVSVFEAMTSAPNAKYCNALRWYNHIKSYKSQFTSLPGVKEQLSAGSESKDDDEDIDLFGSDDEEDEEAERLKEERVRQYQEKKSKKAAVIAKSNIILDVKPWDDETDMAELEKCVRSVEMDGLVWGASKLAPVGYGIKKLQISCVVEDDKVGTELLEEKITEFEDFIQSVDVAAFNKV